MNATHFYESKVLNTFRNITAVGAGPLFVALYVSNPSNTGMAGVEINYPEYTRMPVTFTIPYEESGGIGVMAIGDIEFPESSSDAGEVRHIGILDSSAIGSGNMYLYGELTIPLVVSARRQPSIAAGDMLFYLTGDMSIQFKTRILNILRGDNLPGFVPHNALFDGDPEAAGVELNGGGYARPEIEFSNPLVQVSGQTRIVNSSDFIYPRATSTWGLWAWSGIMSAATSGELVGKTIHTPPEMMFNNYRPKHFAGELRVDVN